MIGAGTARGLRLSLSAASIAMAGFGTVWILRDCRHRRDRVALECASGLLHVRVGRRKMTVPLRHVQAFLVRFHGRQRPSLALSGFDGRTGEFWTLSLIPSLPPGILWMALLRRDASAPSRSTARARRSVG